jgi:hypothetical protein
MQGAGKQTHCMAVGYMMAYVNNNSGKSWLIKKSTEMIICKDSNRIEKC